MSIFRGFVVTLRVLPTAFYTPPFHVYVFVYSHFSWADFGGIFSCLAYVHVPTSPRFSCGTCGAKCSCLPDSSSTSLQVPFTNWWHDFKLPTTYYVMSTSQSYICCYLALLSLITKISAFFARNFQSNMLCGREPRVSRVYHILQRFRAI